MPRKALPSDSDSYELRKPTGDIAASAAKRRVSLIRGELHSKLNPNGSRLRSH